LTLKNISHRLRVTLKYVERIMMGYEWPWNMLTEVQQPMSNLEVCLTLKYVWQAIWVTLRYVRLWNMSDRLHDWPRGMLAEVWQGMSDLEVCWQRSDRVWVTLRYVGRGLTGYSRHCIEVSHKTLKTMINNSGWIIINSWDCQMVTKRTLQWAS